MKSMEFTTQILTSKPIARTESYMHEQAKSIVREWWMEKNYFRIVPVRIDIEQPMSMGCMVKFKPDLAIFDNHGLRPFCEVCHKNPIDSYKLLMMYRYGIMNDINPLIIEVSASWVMGKVNPPEHFECSIFSNFSSLISAALLK